jgi:hypothetical protein
MGLSGTRVYVWFNSEYYEVQSEPFMLDITYEVILNIYRAVSIKDKVHRGLKKERK